MAGRFLDVVEGDFQDDERFDGSNMAVIFDGVTQEKIGVLADFGVRKAGIGFADVQECVSVADGESVIRKNFVAFSVTVFDGGDDDIQSGKGFFQLEPEAAAAAGCVRRIGNLGDYAFVAGGERITEGDLHGVGCAARSGRGDAYGCGGMRTNLAEERFAFCQRFVEEQIAVAIEQVEGDIFHGNIVLNEHVHVFAAEAFL